MHDAVRPFVSQGALERLWDIGSEESDGAILAIPVSDTLKLGLVEKGKMTLQVFTLRKPKIEKTIGLHRLPKCLGLNCS